MPIMKITREVFEKVVEVVEDGMARRYGFTPPCFKETVEEILEEHFEVSEGESIFSQMKELGP